MASGDEYGREGAGLDFMKPPPPAAPAAKKQSDDNDGSAPVAVLQRPAEPVKAQAAEKPFVFAAPPPAAPAAPKPSKSKDYGMGM